MKRHSENKISGLNLEAHLVAIWAFPVSLKGVCVYDPSDESHALAHLKGEFSSGLTSVSLWVFNILVI